MVTPVISVRVNLAILPSRRVSGDTDRWMRFMLSIAAPFVEGGCGRGIDVDGVCWIIEKKKN